MIGDYSASRTQNFRGRFCKLKFASNFLMLRDFIQYAGQLSMQLSFRCTMQRKLYATQLDLVAGFEQSQTRRWYSIDTRPSCRINRDQCRTFRCVSEQAVLRLQRLVRECDGTGRCTADHPFAP